MDHIQIDCECGSSLYHIFCISQLTKCYKCKAAFSTKIIQQIKDATEKVLLNHQKQRKKENKQIIVRKDIQKNITEIIQPFFIKRC